jgi:chromosome segregation ATPase
MYLEWLDNDGEVARLALDPAMEAVTIGRGPASSIYSKETSVSRNHARIGWEPQGYYLKDLGSSNGSFINGERIQRGALHEGDVARCGEVLEIRIFPGLPPDAKKKTLMLNDPGPSGMRRAVQPTSAVTGTDREALVAAARAARLGQSGGGLRTDARPIEPAQREVPRQAPVAPNTTPRQDLRQPTPVPAAPVKPSTPIAPRPVANGPSSASQPALASQPSLPSADSQRRIAQLEEQLHTTRGALHKAENDAKAVEARSMRYSVELDGLSDKYVKLKEHNQVLSRELEKTRADLRSREDEAFEAGRAVTDLKSQIGQAREKAADATEQLSGLKVRITQKDRQIEELQRQLDLLDYELRAARDENDSLQSSFNREGGDLSRLEGKINLLQEVIQEKEALIDQLRIDLRDKDTEIRQVRMGVGISNLEHEKRRLLEDYHQSTRRVDELNDRLLQQTRQTEALKGELDAARDAAERKPAPIADVTEHPDYKQKQREVERAREEASQLQRDLAKADLKLETVSAELAAQKLAAAESLVVQKRAEALEQKLHETEQRLNDALTAPKSTLPVDLADTVESLLDAAVAARSNAAVVRRYASDLAGEHTKWPDLAETLELVNDIASVLANDLAEQARAIEVLHRRVVASHTHPPEDNHS